MSLVAFVVGVLVGWSFVRWERSAKYLAGLEFPGFSGDPFEAAFERLRTASD